MIRAPPKNPTEASQEDIDAYLAEREASKNAPNNGGQNPFQPGAAGAAQRGKVVSISRTELFGVTRTTMKVLMDRGGERTVHADGSSVRIALEIEVGDQVKLSSTGHMQMEWTKVLPLAEKVRKKRKVFDLDSLFSADGLQKVYDSFPLIKWDTRPNCETKALSQIVSMYKSWLFQLYPKMSFAMLVDRLEKLGTKTAVKNLLTDLRYGTPPDWTIHTQVEEGQARNRVELNAAAAEIFNAYTSTLQPGIKRAAGAEDDDDNLYGDEDDIMAALADKYSTPSALLAPGGAAAAAAGAAGGVASGEQSVHALLAKKKAAEAERAKRVAEEQAEMEQRYQEEAELDVFARPVNIFSAAHKPKKRRVVSDDDEEEEAALVPLSAAAAAPPPADAASQEEEVAEEEEDAAANADMDPYLDGADLPLTATEPTSETQQPTSADLPRSHTPTQHLSGAASLVDAAVESIAPASSSLPAETLSTVPPTPSQPGAALVDTSAALSDAAEPVAASASASVPPSASLPVTDLPSVPATESQSDPAPLDASSHTAEATEMIDEMDDFLADAEEA